MVAMRLPRAGRRARWPFTRRKGEAMVTEAAHGEEGLLPHHAVLDGTLRTAGDLRITGRAMGELHCDGTLTIAEGAHVDARVVAGQLIVAGTLRGEITCCGKLHLLPTARVSGRLTTATLAIEDGARYQGELRMATEEAAPQPTGRGAAAGVPTAPGDALAVVTSPQGVVPSRPPRTGGRQAVQPNGAGGPGA
jgi:cytoskeletal protein CcmA (bactofilin family)